MSMSNSPLIWRFLQPPNHYYTFSFEVGMPTPSRVAALQAVQATLEDAGIEATVKESDNDGDLLEALRNDIVFMMMHSRAAISRAKNWL